MVLNEAFDYEGRPASALLEKIKSESTIERSMALALVNALNHQNALQLPVHMLAGTVPLEKDKILKATRHGMGTPVLHKFSRKSYLALM